MNTSIRPLSAIVSFLKRDPILAAAFVAAGVSACFVRPSAAYVQYIDFRVLGLLFALMLVIAGMQQSGLFAQITERLLRFARDTRALAFVLTASCFFSSMLITNDVALITFVPMAILLFGRTALRKHLLYVIVLQTVAANLGSMLTPLGNPQNLYLYSLTGMPTSSFLAIMALPTAVSAALLALALLLLKKEPLPLPEAARQPCRSAGFLPWLAAFGVCMLSVLRVLPFWAAPAAAVAVVLLVQRRLLKQVDYSLLLTFVFFFLFVGNIKSLPAVRAAMSPLVARHELLCGVMLSQGISNVPATMLLSGFAADYPALLVGVNLGGLGTLIASMASIISYKQYAAQPGARTGRYLGVFTLVNVVFLAVLLGVMRLFPPA